MLVVYGRETVVWVPPDGVMPTLGVLEHLCRLKLDARRLGGELALRNPCADLMRLIRFAGLAETLGVEVVGHAGGGEELGIEEVVEPDQLAVGDLDDLE